MTPFGCERLLSWEDMPWLLQNCIIPKSAQNQTGRCTGPAAYFRFFAPPSLRPLFAGVFTRDRVGSGSSLASDSHCGGRPRRGFCATSRSRATMHSFMRACWVRISSKIPVTSTLLSPNSYLLLSRVYLIDFFQLNCMSVSGNIRRIAIAECRNLARVRPLREELKLKSARMLFAMCSQTLHAYNDFVADSVEFRTKFFQISRIILIKCDANAARNRIETFRVAAKLIGNE
jgi:hypothetical protein